MNTIKIYLAESGRIADLRKDFPLYQGQFQNKLLNVFVPTTILAPSFTSQSQNGTILADYVASTSVKIGMTYLSRDGSIKVSKNYYMRFLKTLTYQNVEYALYERKLPQEFTFYAGQGVNAPTLIANVVNIEQATDNGEPKVLSIITSQTCSLDVMPSTSLDNDEAFEPSELDNITAQINEINEILPTKQDKVDETLETESKSVVGAINENKRKIDINIGNIETNTEELADLRNEVDQLASKTWQQETYIGQLEGIRLPSDQMLNNFVQNTVQREPQNADVVIYVVHEGNSAVSTYKYTYYDNGWAGYQLTALSRAANGRFGLLQGTFGVDSENETLVDISGGEILNIYVKDKENNIRNIKEYLSTITSNVDNVISGETSVGLALKTIADKLGNDIVDTYLTKTLGATKQFVRDYAMPREFSSVYFISADGYVPQVPTTPSSGIQFTQTTNNVGSFELFQISKENDADFELTISNGYQNNIFVSASADCDVQFRLTTQYRKVGEDWANLNVELSNPYSLKSGEIQKIPFGSPFTALGDNVLTLSSGDFIRQTLEVVTQTSSSITFDVYSNDIYPSIFSLTSQNYVMRDVELVIGKTIVLGLDGTIEGNNAVFVVQDPNDFIEYRTNQRKFLCLMSLPVVGTLSDDIVVRIEFGETVYNLFSYEKGSATPLTIGDLKSVMSYNVNTGYSFYPELYFVQNTDVEGFVLVPSTITADQLINILGDDGSVIPMANGTKVNFSLSAELTNKIMRALLTPMSAPAQTELVAIDDNGSQTMIELGNSLILQNGTLDVNAQLSGTVVTVGGTPQPTFNADTKVDVSTYNTKMSAIDGDISSIQGDISSIQGDISSIQGDISSLSQELNSAEQDIADNMTEITKKADKVLDATSGDLAQLDTNGNLVDSGKKLADLLSTEQITNCILEAPNGVVTYSGTNLTIKAGLKVLVPNGRNADGTLNNIVYTLEQDETITNTNWGTYKRFFALQTDESLTRVYTGVYFLGYDTKPPQADSSKVERYFNTTDNLYYYHATGTTTWTQETGNIIVLGWFETTSGTITGISPYNVLSVATEEMVRSIVSNGNLVPSNRYVNLSVSAGATLNYIAPANGYVSLKSSGKSGSFLTLSHSGTWYTRYRFNGTEAGGVFVPVKKGISVTVTPGTDVTSIVARFIYAEEV